MNIGVDTLFSFRKVFRCKELDDAAHVFVVISKEPQIKW